MITRPQFSTHMITRPQFSTHVITRPQLCTHVIVSLYRSVIVAVAEFLVDESFMMEDVIGHQRLFPGEVLLLLWAATVGLDQALVSHEVALMLHDETPGGKKEKNIK